MMNSHNQPCYGAGAREDTRHAERVREDVRVSGVQGEVERLTAVSPCIRPC